MSKRSQPRTELDGHTKRKSQPIKKGQYPTLHKQELTFQVEFMYSECDHFIINTNN